MPTTVYRCPVTFPAIPSTGGIAYASAGTDLAILAAGTPGQVLISNGAAAPGWGAIGVTPAALTRVDDTNVTLTLGGTPATALLQAVSVTAGWTGTLAAARLNTNVVQSVVNDTNVTGSIAAQALTLGWTGTLGLTRGGTAANNSTQTYTPTLTNVANVAASTAYPCQYARLGAFVWVTGKVDVDPTLAATSTQLGISLPIASNLGAAEHCAGTAFAPAIAGQGAAMLGDTANDRAQMQWVSTDVSNQAMFFQFGYQVL